MLTVTVTEEIKLIDGTTLGAVTTQPFELPVNWVVEAPELDQAFLDQLMASVNETEPEIEQVADPEEQQELEPDPVQEPAPEPEQIKSEFDPASLWANLNRPKRKRSQSLLDF